MEKIVTSNLCRILKDFELERISLENKTYVKNHLSKI